VDTLIEALITEGASRAADLLKAAKFSEFFDIDFDASSYSGNVQKYVKEVSIYDTPVDKMTKRVRKHVIASYSGVDFEFSGDDADKQ
jgi:hypothetical protein